MADNTAQTWRDLAEQLTAEQIDRLANAGQMTEAELLDVARDLAAANLRQSLMADIPAPPGALRTGPWFHDDETTTRDVYGREWAVGNARARLTGTQAADGATAWQVEFDAAEGTVGALSAEQARQMAAALLEAAEELDRLTRQ